MRPYMKTKFKLGVIIGIMASIPIFTWGTSQDLRTSYLSGPIILKNAPSFGEKTNWALQFYNTFTDIIVAPEGTIFAASGRQNTIFKFDSSGSLIKSFGQEGQGPGDFNGPNNLSILDGRYLVVGEYSLGLRISLFDLEGNFVKLLKTDQSAYYPTALRDGKIAYLGLTHRKLNNQSSLQTQTVLIKDIETQKEYELCSFTTPTRSIRLKRGGTVGFDGETSGWTFLAQTGEGNLAVGISSEPFVTVYSPEGTKLFQFPLRGEPIPVTKQLIRHYKNIQLESLRQEAEYAESWVSDQIHEIEKASFDHLFDETLPFYNELLTDEEGNFLFFRKDECFTNCPIVIDVYSPKGEFICTTEIKSGAYSLIIDKRRKHMCFTKSGLIALVQPKTGESEFILKMIKVEF